MEWTRLKPGPCPAVLLWLICLALFLPQFVSAEPPHPLKPVDTSSPRATLTGFLVEMDEIWTALRDRYWDSPSKQAETEIFSAAARVLRTLDLSEYAPSTRIEVGYDAGTFLYETLSRLELPALNEIPDAVEFDSVDGPAEWTVPHTDITIARIEEGPRKGEFLFSADTVRRANEFFRKTRALPYRRDIPLEDYAEKRHYLSMGGWTIPARDIERFPGWLKYSIFEQAVWKWIALTTLLALTFAAVFAIHRLTRRRLSDRSEAAQLLRLATP